MGIRAVVVSSFVIALGCQTGCGGDATPPAANPPKPEASAEPGPGATPAPEATEKKAEEPAPAKKEEKAPPAAAKKKISEIIAAGGTWAFSLADSPDAKKVAEDDCKKKNKDAKKQEACMKDVEQSAAGEGFRYEKDDKGTWWVSFATEKGKEVIVNKIMFKIGNDAEVGGSATLKPEGKDLGKKPKGKLPPEVTIEMPDENTTVMTDPKKGKLTYKKK